MQKKFAQTPTFGGHKQARLFQKWGLERMMIISQFLFILFINYQSLHRCLTLNYQTNC